MSWAAGLDLFANLVPSAAEVAQSFPDVRLSSAEVNPNVVD